MSVLVAAHAAEGNCLCGRGSLSRACHVQFVLEPMLMWRLQDHLQLATRHHVFRAVASHRQGSHARQRQPCPEQACGAGDCICPTCACMCLMA